MKNLRRLACKFDLDQSERKSSQVNASARKSWPNGVASRPKFSTCGYLRLRLARALLVTALKCSVVVFLGKTLNFHPGVQIDTDQFEAGGWGDS